MKTHKIDQHALKTREGSRAENVHRYNNCIKATSSSYEERAELRGLNYESSCVKVEVDVLGSRR